MTLCCCLQVLLGNVRPSPPPQLASIFPAHVLQQSSTADWACSAEGLTYLSRLLRPGVLLEYHRRTTNSWQPALLLHSSLVRPKLSSQLKQKLLQQEQELDQGHQQDGCIASSRVNAKGFVATCKWLRDSEEGQQLPCYQPPGPDDSVLVLLLLSGTVDAPQVRHVKWQQLCGAAPCVRRMLHWVADDDDEAAADVADRCSEPNGTAAVHRGSDASGGSAGGLSHGSEAPAACEASPAADSASKAAAQGSWQLLTHLRCWPLNRLVRSTLAAEQKSWLKQLGWPRRGRPKRRSSAAAVPPSVVASIARKLARRPTAAGLPPTLAAAAGLSPDSSKLRRRQVLAPRPVLANSPEGRADAGGPGRKGRGPRRRTGSTDEVQHRRGHQRKRRSKRLLSDASSDSEEGGQVGEQWGDMGLFF